MTEGGAHVQKARWHIPALVAFAGSLLWVVVAIALLITDGAALPVAVAAGASAVFGIGLGLLSRRRIDASNGAYRGRQFAVAAIVLGWFAFLAAGALVFWLLLPDSAPPTPP